MKPRDWQTIFWFALVLAIVMWAAFSASNAFSAEPEVIIVAREQMELFIAQHTAAVQALDDALREIAFLKAKLACA